MIIVNSVMYCGIEIKILKNQKKKVLEQVLEKKQKNQNKIKKIKGGRKATCSNIYLARRFLFTYSNMV